MLRGEWERAATGPGRCVCGVCTPGRRVERSRKVLRGPAPAPRTTASSLVTRTPKAAGTKPNRKSRPWRCGSRTPSGRCLWPKPGSLASWPGPGSERRAVSWLWDPAGDTPPQGCSPAAARSSGTRGKVEETQTEIERDSERKRQLPSAPDGPENQNQGRRGRKRGLGLGRRAGQLSPRHRGVQSGRGRPSRSLRPPRRAWGFGKRTSPWPTPRRPLPCGYYLLGAAALVHAGRLSQTCRSLQAMSAWFARSLWVATWPAVRLSSPKAPTAAARRVQL